MPERIGQPAGQPTPTHDPRLTAPLPQAAIDAITRLETALTPTTSRRRLIAAGYVRRTPAVNQ